MKYSPKRKWLANGAAVGVGMIGVHLAIYYGRSSLMLLTIGMAILMLAIFALCTLAFLYSDETQRAVHKDAWYWGSAAGILVTSVVIIVLTHAPFLMPVDFEIPRFLSALHRRSDSFAYFAEGALFVLFAQTAGFVLVWCGWRLWSGKR